MNEGFINTSMRSNARERSPAIIVFNRIYDYYENSPSAFYFGLRTNCSLLKLVDTSIFILENCHK